MKQMIMAVLLIGLKLSVTSQTVNVKTTTGVTATVYSSAGTNSQITSTKSYADQKDIALEKRVKNSLDSLALVLRQENQKQLEAKFASLDSMFGGRGMRIDSLRPRAKQLTPQVYYDPISKTYKTNY